ncbi:unnamed protein product [Brassica rapa subsp. trilocularis]
MNSTPSSARSFPLSLLTIARTVDRRSRPSMNFFKAVFDRVDFRSKLNKWAEDHTNGLIKDLLPRGSISSLTNCVYGNALYFKGAWQVPFLKSSGYLIDKAMMRPITASLINKAFSLLDVLLSPRQE